MDRKELIESDAYWTAKIDIALYHKNYKGQQRRAKLIKEILKLKKELIGVCDNTK